MLTEEVYCLLQREVNRSTGQIAVIVCMKGSQEFISKKAGYYKLRSIFNEELTYYLVKQENEKEAIKKLKNRVVNKDNLYVKI